jgi:hypothetical protein
MITESPALKVWSCINSTGRMAWLGEELPDKDQVGRTPLAPRCTKDLIEKQLFACRRDLFTRP